MVFCGFRGITRFPMWALFLSYVLVGWICVNLGIWLYYESLGWLIEVASDPPVAWTEAWAADGAKRVFGLFFGWIYAIVYYAFWVLIALISRPLLAIVKSRGSSRQPLSVSP